jgi:hypothetical protein
LETIYRFESCRNVKEGIGMKIEKKEYVVEDMESDVCLGEKNDEQK